MFRFVTKIKNSEYGKRVKEKLYPGYQEHELRIAMERFRKCDTVKKSSRMKQEIQLYKRFWGCYPYEYFLADLYRQDNPLTRQEILDYIPSFFWFELFLPHHTAYNYSHVIDNKIFTDQIFRSLKIAQPDTLCTIVSNTLYSPGMVKSTFSQILEGITMHSPEKIFAKPAESGAGRGIYIFHKDGDQYITREGIHFDKEFLCSIGKNSNYILQPGVLQDREISAIFPGSVNTIRIITENFTGESRAVCAMLRMGRGLSGIDNAATGGLFTGIDINTGKIGTHAMSKMHEKFSRHPDSGFEFRNCSISGWDDVLRFATESADKLPFFAHLGWDIALTPQGPIAIETNINMGIEGMQIANGGLREKFGITHPDYYWKHPGKRI